MAAWLRVALDEARQRVVREEQESHPNPRVRQRMLVLWCLHCNLSRVQAAEVAGVSRATVARVVAAFREGGLDAVRRWDVQGPTSELAAYRDVIRASFERQPARTMAEAAERIEQLTGLRRGPTQVRKFLKGLGLKWQRVRSVPLPPKRVSTSTSPPSRRSSRTS
jgi:transposase